MKMRPLVLAIGALLGGAVSDSGSAETPSPMWARSLTEDLGSARQMDHGKLRDHDRAGLVFLDNDWLVVYERRAVPALSSREGLQTSRFRLRASLLRAATGELQLRKEWGTRLHESGVYATTGGLVVRTGRTLRLCSRDLEEIRRLELSTQDLCDDRGVVAVRVSGSGRTVLTTSWGLNPYRTCFEVRDGDTLKQRSFWVGTTYWSAYSLSDIGVLHDEEGEHVLMTPFGRSTWRVVWSCSPPGCAYSQALTDGLLLNLSRGEVLLLSAGGQTLMTDRCEKHESIGGQAAVAQGGAAFAVTSALTRREWLADLLDANIHASERRVVVYSVRLKKRILTVPVLPLPKLDYDFALSPDGSKLAVLNDRRVALYAVPIQ